KLLADADARINLAADGLLAQSQAAAQDALTSAELAASEADRAQASADQGVADTTAVLNQVQSSGNQILVDAEAVLQQVIAQAYRDVEAVLGEVLGKIDPHALAFKLSMLVSTLAGPLPVDGDGSELRDGLRAPALRERFLDLLMEHLRR
ncbi:MAG TPA: hypothetical protein P5076_25155, partial [Myxococcota bacterium]|nr:hypothetical protein [Myxococcota bacterium]